MAQAATMAEGQLSTASASSLSGRSARKAQDAEDAEEIRKAEIELRFQQLIPLVAQQIARMEVTSPEVVRVTPAYRAFEKGAVAFRKEYAGDFFFKSERSEKISTFWSHSWQGGHWKLSSDRECNHLVFCDETV